MPKQSKKTKTTRKLEHPERYRCSEFIKLTLEKQQEKRLEYLYQIKQIMENCLENKLNTAASSSSSTKAIDSELADEICYLFSGLRKDSPYFIELVDILNSIFSLLENKMNNNQTLDKNEIELLESIFKLMSDYDRLLDYAINNQPEIDAAVDKYITCSRSDLRYAQRHLGQILEEMEKLLKLNTKIEKPLEKLEDIRQQLSNLPAFQIMKIKRALFTLSDSMKDERHNSCFSPSINQSRKYSFTGCITIIKREAISNEEIANGILLLLHLAEPLLRNRGEYSYYQTKMHHFLNQQEIMPDNTM